MAINNVISFYPGPSKIHPEIKDYMSEACDSGILSVNHRSTTFVDLSKRTITLLKEKLSIPESYEIFFVSSATEAWEIISQEFLNEKFLHVFNGAFGQKWFEYSQKLKPNGLTASLQFDINEELPVEQINCFEDCQLICVTQNETSNATRVSNHLLSSLKVRNPRSLIAVDATSSMGGEELIFSSADIWFASVQKCFGLPAGMGIMVCSPDVIARLHPCSEAKYYNSISFMSEMIKYWQTTYTPNVLSIFLLCKVLEESSNINITSQRLFTRCTQLYNFFAQSQKVKILVDNYRVRSHTVLALTGSEDMLFHIKKEAAVQGMLIGNGYGKWKSSTIRIANFPAHDDSEFELLKTLF